MPEKNDDKIDGRFTQSSAGNFSRNLMFFGRLLRAAGLPVGSASIVDAIKAVEVAGFSSREDFYWVLHSVFVKRREHRALFDQAFHLFWRNPDMLHKAITMLLPNVTDESAKDDDQLSRRVRDALGLDDVSQPEDAKPPERENLELEGLFTYSGIQTLRTRDFDDMSASEIAQAKAVIAKMKLPIMELPVRRYRPDVKGNIVDMRRSLKAGIKSGGDIIPLLRKGPVKRHPPLVVLSDISGSMSSYSRLFLHFIHAVTNNRDRVHSFLFGTRLTNITRALQRRDIDEALRDVGAKVMDWEGGTRIGACMKDFNRNWSRRVLGQGAVVLLITDGLDRDGGAGLSREIERLQKSCRQLIWLNPLLSYREFSPKAAGIRAILPHVDQFRPLYNLETLADLADALGGKTATFDGKALPAKGEAA